MSFRLVLTKRSLSLPAPSFSWEHCLDKVSTGRITQRSDFHLTRQ